jgi:hypothetical protein
VYAIKMYCMDLKEQTGCACIEVGNGGKTKHVMSSADFFGQLKTVDVKLGLDNDQLHGACGLNALLMVPHVAHVNTAGRC